MRDVGMVERRQHLRFALEPREPFGIVRRTVRQDLDGDVAIELRVAGAVDLAHAARADRRDDFVRAKPRSDGQRHEIVADSSDSWTRFHNGS